MQHLGLECMPQLLRYINQNMQRKTEDTEVPHSFLQGPHTPTFSRYNNEKQLQTTQYYLKIKTHALYSMNKYDYNKNSLLTKNKFHEFSGPDTEK